MQIKCEVPDGPRPGNAFTLSSVPSSIVGLFWGGTFQSPDEYQLSGNTITTKFVVQPDDQFWVVFVPAL